MRNSHDFPQKQGGLNGPMREACSKFDHGVRLFQFSGQGAGEGAGGRKALRRAGLASYVAIQLLKSGVVGNGKKSLGLGLNTSPRSRRQTVSWTSGVKCHCSRDWTMRSLPQTRTPDLCSLGQTNSVAPIQLGICIVFRLLKQVMKFQSSVAPFTLQCKSTFNGAWENCELQMQSSHTPTRKEGLCLRFERVLPH